MRPITATAGRVAAALAVAALGWGCRTAAPLNAPPCSRVDLEPAPPWTASAALRQATPARPADLG